MKNKTNQFFPSHYAEVKVTVRPPAMRAFREQRIGELGVSDIIDSLYKNDTFLKYIEPREASCKYHVLDGDGSGEESVALHIEELNLVLHGLLEIIEVNGPEGDAFELTFNGLDEPCRVRGIIPQKISLRD